MQLIGNGNLIESVSLMLDIYGSPAAWSISRSDKLRHYQTILYEIDMLRFAYGRMPEIWPDAKEADLWVYLESFVLHYRNLIELFGKDPTDETDLSIRRPEEIWPHRYPRPSEPELAEMQARFPSTYNIAQHIEFRQEAGNLLK
jgi:hypothetical protein